MWQYIFDWGTFVHNYWNPLYRNQSEREDSGRCSTCSKSHRREGGQQKTANYFLRELCINTIIQSHIIIHSFTTCNRKYNLQQTKYIVCIYVSKCLFNLGHFDYHRWWQIVKPLLQMKWCWIVPGSMLLIFLMSKLLSSFRLEKIYLWMI